MRHSPPFLSAAITLTFLPGTLLFSSDSIRSKSTYSEAYGATKKAVAVDVSKDLPRYPAVEPKDAVATWKVKPGFELQLAANEPQVRDPVAISFDENGRMFVVEMIDYSEMRDVTPHLGRISVLEDKDGDGIYETSTVFADDLPWPTGVICSQGGIYVIATPDIYFLKDTKGTGKADVREVVFTGFGTGMKVLNVQGMANCPQWGLDNRIHLQAGGGNRGKVKCLKRPDLAELELGGRDFWWDPRTYEFGLEAGGGQYGMSYDNYGRKFVCSNSDHLQFFAYDASAAAKNPAFSMPPPRQSIAADGGAAEVFRISPDEPWRIIRTRWRVAGVVQGAVEGGGRVSGYFTGASGTTIYRGDVYGPEFLNNAFSGDAGGQLIHRKELHPDGVSLIGKRPADEHGFEFAASSDTWVRVVNFANAPDGCLHVMDMYREVIEHPWAIPDEIKSHLDLNSGNDRGRIYRLAPKRADWKRRNQVALGNASVAELVHTLEHPNGWHRDCAARLLYEKQDPTASPLLEKLLHSSSNSLAKIHALAVLDGLNALTPPVVSRALHDTDPFVRERGMFAAMSLRQKQNTDAASPSFALWKEIAAMVADSHPRVRFYAALAMAHAGKDIRIPALSTLAQSDSADPWIGPAILNSADAALFAGLRTHLGKLDPQFSERLFMTLGSLKNQPELEAQLIETVAGTGPKLEWLRGLGDGLKRRGSSISGIDSGKKFLDIFEKARITISTVDASEPARMEAIQLLKFAPSALARPALLACLAKTQPASIQTAAIGVLGTFQTNDTIPALVSGWSGLQKEARNAAIPLFLGRPEHCLALLHAIEANSISLNDLTASDSQALFKHKDLSVAALADKVLASLKPPTRASVLEAFEPALASKGDATRGQTLFLQRCMICHRANNLGLQVGPDLITVKSKGREGIMIAILDPNKEVAPQYISYTVNTKDGQTLVGIITKDDSSSLAIRTAGGAEMDVPRANVKAVTSSGMSLMPEGLETGLKPEELADLLAFIEDLK